MNSRIPSLSGAVFATANKALSNVRPFFAGKSHASGVRIDSGGRMFAGAGFTHGPVLANGPSFSRTKNFMPERWRRRYRLCL